MLYKFISENEIKPYKGGFIVIDNRIYTNPTEEKIKEAGFKPLAEVEMPEYDEAKEYVAITYKDGENEITPVYEVIAMEFEEIESEV